MFRQTDRAHFRLGEDRRGDLVMLKGSRIAAKLGVGKGVAFANCPI